MLHWWNFNIAVTGHWCFSLRAHIWFREMQNNWRLSVFIFEKYVENETVAVLPVFCKPGLEAGHIHWLVAKTASLKSRCWALIVIRQFKQPPQKLNIQPLYCCSFYLQPDRLNVTFYLKKDWKQLRHLYFSCGVQCLHYEMLQEPFIVWHSSKYLRLFLSALLPCEVICNVSLPLYPFCVIKTALTFIMITFYCNKEVI